MLAHKIRRAAREKNLTLIDRTAGTNIGDMTGAGGLAAAFDGDTTENKDACARVEASPGWVGKTLAASKIFGKAIIYGSDNAGFAGNSNPTITLTMYGKTGSAPANSTDGTVLGTTSFSDTADESAGREISSTNEAAAWAHIWVRVSDSVGTDNLNVAELELYELV